jgi:RNA polymerase sigma-70 factor (ECF subfamily)
MSLDVAALWEAEHQAVQAHLRYRLGADWEMADDLTSEVFVKVWAKRGAYREMDGIPVRAWLFRLVHNILVDYWRGRSRRAAVSFDALSKLSYTVRFGDVDQQIEIEAALETLTPPQRATIIGRYYERRRVADLGHIGTVDSVKKLQARALVNLRKVLEAA